MAEQVEAATAGEAEVTSASVTTNDPVVQAIFDAKYGAEDAAAKESTDATSTETTVESDAAAAARQRDEKGRFVKSGGDESAAVDADVTNDVQADAPKFNEAVLREAESIGLTVAEAKDFGSEAALRRYVDAERRAAQAAQATEAAAAEQTTKETTESILQFPEEPEEWNDDSLLTPAERYQRDALRAMRADAEARAQRDAQAQREAQAEQYRRDSDELDAFIGKLGEGFEDVYGKGDWRTLDVNSPYRRERASLFQAAEALKAVMPKATADQRRDAAIRALHGERHERLIQQRYAASLKKQALGRTGQQVTATATRTAPPATGRAADDPVIVEALNAMLQENGA